VRDPYLKDRLSGQALTTASEQSANTGCIRTGQKVSGGTTKKLILTELTTGGSMSKRLSVESELPEEVASALENEDVARKVKGSSG